jgi:hypothetical protein
MEFILNEVRSACIFVSTRAKLAQQVGLTQIVQRFADKVLKLINTHTISSSEVSILLQEFASSPYTDLQTTTIIQALDNKFISALQGPDDPTPNAHAHDGGPPAIKSTL